ncbi:hypothetical protein GCM10009794_15860 [Rothia terrae]
MNRGERPARVRERDCWRGTSLISVVDAPKVRASSSYVGTRGKNIENRQQIPTKTQEFLIIPPVFVWDFW